MARLRQIQAVLSSVQPSCEPEPVGVHLAFEPRNTRLLLETIEDFASLATTGDVDAVAGVGKVMRILRVARIAAPRDQASYLDRAAEVAALLKRALGTELLLDVKPRARLHFTVWTEEGVDTVYDIKEVIELPDGFLAVPLRGAMATYYARKDVVRQKTEVDRWYEVVEIQLPE